MEIFVFPAKENWHQLIERPKIKGLDIESVVRPIFSKIREQGDKALYFYSKKFDKASLSNLKVTDKEIEDSIEAVSSKELKDAMAVSISNINRFHSAQIKKEEKVETMEGIHCWAKRVPIQRVGLYIPGGTAPLFSTLLMLGIPAKIAGCKEIIVCSPPNPDGTINPVILYASRLVRVKSIFKVGGAQAIAAMTYGTETVPRVDKIFGPGNSFVTKAKELAQTLGVAIDLPAGPSEVLVVADKNANPSFVASDLLAQAEHGFDSQVILLSDNESIVHCCINELKKQLKYLPRKKIIEQSIKHSKAIVLENLDKCMEFSNYYAPEHLIIATDNSSELSREVQNAGSVFLGSFSCESAGDYATGTNHTLPTNRFARSYSGVSTESFMKRITFQKITEKGIQNIGKHVEIMAENEGLQAHKNAVSIRLKSLNDRISD